MLLKIAWKNIWRNRTRSLVVIGAVALGIWAGMFIISFSWGMYHHRIEEAIKNEFSNIQLHHPQFSESYDMRYNLIQTDSITAFLTRRKEVKAYATRTIAFGMIATASGNGAVKLTGIDTAQEWKMGHLQKNLTQGSYFTGTRQIPVVIGKKLADKLHAKIKSKVVISWQAANGQLVTSAFKITGIYETTNNRFDELVVYVPAAALQQLSNSAGLINEIAVSMHTDKQTTEFADQLKITFGSTDVKTWMDLLPEMAYALEMFDKIMNLVILIILTALAFGIINTMLMAILERVKELGMLMAVGMSKIRIFLMIMLESVMLTLAGLPVGLLLAYTTISYFGVQGIDLSLFATGLKNFGFDTVVYPRSEPIYYGYMALQVCIVALVASILPARRALKLNPVESIRTI